MAKKTVKYPRKLRHTLEKIVDKREMRENALTRTDNEPNPFMTLWWEFLMNKQVHTMYSRLEGDDIPSLKLITRATMRPPRTVDVISPLAPWLVKTPSPAE